MIYLFLVLLVAFIICIVAAVKLFKEESTLKKSGILAVTGLTLVGFVAWYLQGVQL